MLLSSKTQIRMAKLKTRHSCVMSLLSKCHFFGGNTFGNSAGHNRCKEADTKRMLNKRNYACTCCVLGRGKYVAGEHKGAGGSLEKMLPQEKSNVLLLCTAEMRIIVLARSLETDKWEFYSSCLSLQTAMSI